jgi:predicted cobalt transporter CbtA
MHLRLPIKIQLVILNACAFVGRLSPGFFAHRLGVVNMLTAATGAGAVVIMSMIALRTTVSLVVVGVLYGYFAGICASPPPHPRALLTPSSRHLQHVVATLMAPLFAILTDDMGELGCATSLLLIRSLNNMSSHSLRMDVGFAVVGLASLIGAL